ncbi:NADH:flavin oxidoreductase/NADH oxidase [Tricharina praecox]|uniref:NADH:flavin oxidoreductase/NADH oxidase n=1 Tax=Tricharina praecox TaxID=43433 RepID=UPI0022211BBD|nr:NADH:flavin oxidoreductase/NADH oxidase [Tricharina praecox]KAI5846800.1 NADH:flavin oxidoreductase/NADH oxidase [Tricharina praecox]
MHQPTNTAAPGVSYFTPHQTVPSGTSLAAPEATPAVFRPLTIRSSTFPNRIWCAPMCMYSADNGHATDFHVQHLGAIATRGAGMIMSEAAAVTKEGRISKEDLGIWDDAHIASLARVATYIHSQSKHFSVQLAHAGRKASTVAPWLDHERGKSILATPQIGGWPSSVVGASPIRWSADHALPRELTTAEIAAVVAAFAAAAVRCVKAGVDSLQIHAAHGYLVHSFMSGASNTRTDAYGGAFENRVRILLEIVDAVREVIPSSMPLMVRVSGTDWLPEEKYPTAWTLEDTVRLAKQLYAHGVDLLDVSSGGNHENQQISPHNTYQVQMAEKVKAALLAEGGEPAKLLVSAVGAIADGVWANKIVAEMGVDAVFVARAFLRDPNFVLRCAEELGVRVQPPLQYLRMGRLRREEKL